ncbi:hypothetical protein L0F63_006158 [Massospora cicadina]|nr:hypothetical protein L0F63_006158 [Massospora cicadina]
MFPDIYKIQCSTVFVTFCLWFLSAFAIRYFQHSTRHDEPDPNKEAGAISENQRHRNAIAAERTLLDGHLLLAIGVGWNIFGQGNRTAGDVFSLVTMALLFFMMVMHYAGLTGKTHFLWIPLALSLLGLYLTPLCSASVGLGHYQVVDYLKASPTRG